MTLNEKLMADFKEAMKAHDEVRKNTISFARAAIKQYEVDNRQEADDQTVFQILSKQVKMRKDALADFEKAGRDDLAADYKAEIAVLEEYLPKQLSADEIRSIVIETADQLGITGGKENMGKLMGACMGRLKGQADGNAVRAVVTEFLG